MKKYFQNTKVKLNDIYGETIDFVSDKFKQAGHLFSITSAYGQIISVIQNVSQKILFYIEDSITELNITQAIRPHSIYGLARLTGHDATRAISATGEISLSFNGKQNQIPNGIVIIPNQAVLKCNKNGLEYILELPQHEIRLPLVKNRGLNANILQGKWENQTFTGTGLPLQSFECNMKVNKLIENFNVKVFVNSIAWPIYKSIYDMPFNKPGCIVKTGITSGIDIYFGNSFNGRMPDLGTEIRVEYLVTDGVKGELEVDNNIKWTWVDVGYDQFGNEVDLNDLIDVSLNLPCNFSSNPENPDLTKLLAPKVSQSLILVRPENYIYFFEKFNLFSVIDSWTSFNDDNLKDDNVIYLFLIPDIRKRIDSSENYFTTQLSDFTLSKDDKNKVLRLLSDSQSTLVSSLPVLVDPIIRKYIAHVNLIVFDTINEETIKEEVVSKISDYFITIRRRDRIPKSDLIRIIENVEGVDSVNLYFLGEENELIQRLNPTQGLPDVGLDEFGDIVMLPEELVILRGGFDDRNGVSYSDGVDFTKPSSVNIHIKGTVPKDFNSKINDINKNKIANNG